MVFLQKIYYRTYITKIQNKYDQLKNISVITPQTFLFYQLLVCLLILFSSIIFLKYGYLLGPIISIIWAIFYEYYIFDRKIKQKTKKLNQEALPFFEILAITLESTQNFQKSLEITSNNINSQLSLEFITALTEKKAGKSLDEALKNLQKRINNEEITKIIINLRQHINNNNILNILKNQIIYLREQKKAQLKKETIKLRFKLIITATLFIIPILLLIILSPVIIKTMIG